MPPKNFNNYDVASQGGAGFDIKDRRYLKQQGASRKQIGQVRNSYYDGGGQRTNAQNEQRRIKDMGPIDSSQPISNFDVGMRLFGVKSGTFNIFVGAALRLASFAAAFITRFV